MWGRHGSAWHRQLVAVGGEERRDAGIGRNHAAIATPVTFAQCVNAWVRAERMSVELAGGVGWGRATKDVGNLIVGGQEALDVARRFDALHDALSSPCWLVGILGPVVEALVLAVRDAGHHIALGGAIASALVGYHHPGSPTLFLQQFA